MARVAVSWFSLEGVHREPVVRTVVSWFELEGVQVEAVAPPVFAGGGIAQLPRPFPIEGIGYGILPELEGEAHGVVVVVGHGLGTLAVIGGMADATVAVAGRSTAQVVIRAEAIGDRGQIGAAVAELKGIAPAGSGSAAVCGKGSGMIVNLEGAARGRHDDDEAAVMAFLLAA